MESFVSPAQNGVDCLLTACRKRRIDEALPNHVASRPILNGAGSELEREWAMFQVDPVSGLKPESEETVQVHRPRHNRSNLSPKFFGYPSKHGSRQRRARPGRRDPWSMLYTVRKLRPLEAVGFALSKGILFSRQCINRSPLALVTNDLAQPPRMPGCRFLE